MYNNKLTLLVFANLISTGLTPICVLISPISFYRSIVLSFYRAILPSCFRAFVLSCYRAFVPSCLRAIMLSCLRAFVVFGAYSKLDFFIH